MATRIRKISIVVLVAFILPGMQGCVVAMWTKHSVSAELVERSRKAPDVENWVAWNRAEGSVPYSLYKLFYYFTPVVVSTDGRSFEVFFSFKEGSSYGLDLLLEEVFIELPSGKRQVIAFELQDDVDALRGWLRLSKEKVGYQSVDKVKFPRSEDRILIMVYRLRDRAGQVHEIREKWLLKKTTTREGGIGLKAD